MCSKLDLFFYDIIVLTIERIIQIKYASAKRDKVTEMWTTNLKTTVYNSGGETTIRERGATKG